MNHILGYTTLTASGQAFEIDFPLHPQIRSAEGVSDLMTALLETLSHTLAGRGDISDGDVLQALTMTLAIRARMADASPDATSILVEELFRDAHRAACAAQAYSAGRA